MTDKNREAPSAPPTALITSIAIPTVIVFFILVGIWSESLRQTELVAEHAWQWLLRVFGGLIMFVALWQIFTRAVKNQTGLDNWALVFTAGLAVSTVQWGAALAFGLVAASMIIAAAIRPRVD